jgi:hypothetical protein
VDNAEIADRLDAFAAVLELGDANPCTIRAYRRAAESVRHSGVPLVEIEQLRGDLHCHTTWSDGRVSIAEMARAARARGYEYLAICDTPPR